MKIQAVDLDLPAELLAGIETLAAMLSRDAAPLEDSEEGRDILDLLDTQGTELARMLRLYSRVYPIQNFQERVLVYERTEGDRKKKQKATWSCERIEPAGTNVMTTEPEHLRQLMRSLLQLAPNTSVALWIHAARMSSDKEFFLVYVQHQAGLEAMYMVAEDQWVSMRLSESAIERVLGMLRQLRVSDRKRREGLIKLHERALGQEAYGVVVNALSKVSGPDLTQEQWAAIVSQLTKGDVYTSLVLEAGRVLTTPAIQEAHTVMASSLRLVDAALKHADERVAQAVKDHERVQKRFRKDLEMYKLAQKGATGRAAQLSKEMTELRRQLRAATGPGAKSASGGSVGLALDAYFPSGA